MIVGISSETDHLFEHAVIHQLFNNGMDLFHIRKYDYSDQQIIDYIGKINEVFRNRLVLHSHHHLAKGLKIQRLHINERLRETRQGYRAKESLLTALNKRQNHSVALMALGGIHQENYASVKTNGADGAGLLGSIWQHPQPINMIQKCKEIDSLY